MPLAITRLRSITDAGSELCADNNLQVPFPLFLSGDKTSRISKNNLRCGLRIFVNIWSESSSVWTLDILSLKCIRLNISWKSLYSVFTFTQRPNSGIVLFKFQLITHGWKQNHEYYFLHTRPRRTRVLVNIKRFESFHYLWPEIHMIILLFDLSLYNSYLTNTHTHL